MSATATRSPMRLKFKDRSAEPTKSFGAKPKQRPPTIGTESLVVKCGHTIPLDLYAKDPFRDQRRAKEVARDCPACRQVRVVAETAAAAERRAQKKAAKKAAAEASKPRPRLPDGSRITAVYDAEAVQWAGTLTVEGAVFDRRASGIKTLLRRLDDAYRATLRAPETELLVGRVVITYAERQCFRPQHVQILRLVEAHVARVFDAWGNELRCHEIARAVHLVLGEPESIRVVDGKCGPIEHSWIVLPGGVILDPYVPGRMPAVQMIDPLVGIAYRSGSCRDDVRDEIVRQHFVGVSARRKKCRGDLAGITPVPPQLVHRAIATSL